MTLTISVAVVLGLLGLLGLFRGVRRGIVALAGTLLAAVLVDLWQEPWAEWVRTSLRPEQPALPTFVLTAAIFLTVALLIGYGGSLLLPRPPADAPPLSLLDRLLGALVGALNGALIVSYLLRYAAELWAGDELAAQVSGSVLAGVLDSWLPWFILALVGTTAVFVLLRASVRISRALRAKPAPAAVPAGGKPATKPAEQTGAAGQPRSVAEADRRVSDKISQALKDHK